MGAAASCVPACGAGAWCQGKGTSPAVAGWWQQKNSAVESGSAAALRGPGGRKEWHGVCKRAEIQEAVRSIEEWQKAQAQAFKTGTSTARVGGLDVVKKVVELFYRKLYADPQLIKYLHDQDPMHLRAKQSMFVSWLFGPPNVPYTGKSVRIAHLRIIKQRGFSPEDFDLGMKYFEEAMTELGAPEVLRGEVMRRMLPYKDAIFTPAAGDAAEEARWAAEAAAEAARAESPHNGSHAASAEGAGAVVGEEESDLLGAELAALVAAEDSAAV
eukprot:XP_001697881.1 predicted protein [Chlamydomonas reinhardtii]